MIGMIANKMLTLVLIEPTAIVAWIFSDDMTSELERMWTWELLDDAVEHVRRQLRRFRLKLQEVQKRCNAKKYDDGESSGRNLGTDETDKEESDDNKELEELNKYGVKFLENGIDDLCEYLEDLLLDALRNFVAKIEEYIVDRESRGEDFNTNWYKYFTDRFRSFFLKNWREVFEFSDGMGEKLFTAQEIDPRVMESYNMIVSLRR